MRDIHVQCTCVPTYDHGAYTTNTYRTLDLKKEVWNSESSPEIEVKWRVRELLGLMSLTSLSAGIPVGLEEEEEEERGRKWRRRKRGKRNLVRTEITHNYILRQALY